MTRPEKTGIRPLDFSNWVRRNLPDSSTGYMVTDLDFILSNYRTKKIMMLEIKTRRSRMPEFQRRLFADIDRWIKQGIDGGWQFLGFHLLVFENNSFEDGRAWFDNIEISEADLKRKLSF